MKMFKRTAQVYTDFQLLRDENIISKVCWESNPLERRLTWSLQSVNIGSKIYSNILEIWKVGRPEIVLFPSSLFSIIAMQSKLIKL